MRRFQDIVLQNTKVTEPKSIEQPWPNLEPHQSTASLSRVSVPNTAYEKGLFAEELVIQYFKQRGFQLICHRKKFAGVEVDLVFMQNGTYVAVEVKSVRGQFENYQRVTRSQVHRLKRTFQTMIENTEKEFDLYVAFVDLERQTLELLDFNDL
jgi:Holliday junction resolvase-like predicted endonuclease